MSFTNPSALILLLLLPLTVWLVWPAQRRPGMKPRSGWLGLSLRLLILALVVLSLAGQTYQLCAGDSYVIDTGEPHSFSNPSGQVCRIVSAHTPASF